jgi:thioesterase domain-containing protein/acyl-coenzyme A synthetase/AMP-(fatty) acid ligase/acyl carrier protein
MLFDSRWYDETMIERLLGHLRGVLLGFLEDQDRTLAEIPLLTPAEQRELIVDWNRGPEPDPSPLHLRALEHARSTPERVALAAGQDSMTWAELGRRAGRLAGALVEAGVAPGDRVAVVSEAAPDLAVALLGILNAGAVFLSLDPQSPGEELEALFQRLGIAALITPDGVTVRTDGLKSGGDSAACLLAGPGAAAVEMLHSALARAAAALEHLHPFDGEETVLLVPAGPWGMVAVDLLAALALGARVAFCEADATYDGKRLAQRLAASGATLLQAPAAIWTALLMFGWTGDPRLVGIVRGAGLSRGLARELSAKTAALFTVYGSSETAGWAAAGRVEPFPPEHDSLPAVGRPAPGVRLYLLNEDLQPVAADRPGWIFAADRIAHGYAAQAERTAERFVPDPFTDAPGSRLFFTGDLGRLLPGAQLEVLAHADSLIPVSAAYDARVEIESVLRGHPELLDSAVSPWVDEAGESHWAAHLVPRHPAFPSITEVSGYLKERLPRGIVPALFIKSARLPWKPDGRIDRRALAALGEEGKRAATPFIPPCNPLELRLKQIWEDLFGFRPIGIQDDFFELGGHSLLAIRLMTLIREEFGRDLHLTALLKASTIEDLAKALDEQETARSWSPLVPINQQGTRLPLFCVHALGGEVLCYVDLTRFLGTDQPVYGLQARAWSGLDLEDPESIEAIAAEYVAALRTVQPAGPYRILGYSLGGLVALEMARLLQSQGEELHLLAILDTLITGEEITKWDVPEILAGLVSNHPCVSVEHLRRLDDDLEAQLTYFVERTTEAGIVPGLDLKTARCWARACIAHRKVRKTYEPTPLQGHVTLLRALEGHIRRSADPSLGWQALAGEGLDIVDVPGNHDTLIQLPHVQVLARKLAMLLAE